MNKLEKRLVRIACKTKPVDFSQWVGKDVTLSTIGGAVFPAHISKVTDEVYNVDILGAMTQTGAEYRKAGLLHLKNVGTSIGWLDGVINETKSPLTVISVQPFEGELKRSLMATKMRNDLRKRKHAHGKFKSDFNQWKRKLTSIGFGELFPIK